jgi:hypothetical protein
MVRKLEWETREDDMVSFLEQVGPDGWELVAVVPTSPATPDEHWAYFKRPKAPPQEGPDADAGGDAGPRLREFWP